MRAGPRRVLEIRTFYPPLPPSCSGKCRFKSLSGKEKQTQNKSEAITTSADGSCVCVRVCEKPTRKLGRPSSSTSELCGGIQTLSGSRWKSLQPTAKKKKTRCVVARNQYFYIASSVDKYRKQRVVPAGVRGYASLGYVTATSSHTIPIKTCS